MVVTLHRRLAHAFLVLVMVLASMQLASHSVRGDVTDPYLVAYVSAGGSLDDLCLTDEGDHGGAECPFCREVDVVALAEPAQDGVPALFSSDLGFVVVEGAAAPDNAIVLPQARAPPVA